MKVEWGSVADWAQAISSTVVLLMIYLQMRQVNTQMVQNDDQERFRRSWEFVRLYQDELREFRSKVEEECPDIDGALADASSSQIPMLTRDFMRPRIHLFVLLNHLVQHQEVDERILFGYLEEEFNQFVHIGIKHYGVQEFQKAVGRKMHLLLTLWGTQIKCNALLKAGG